MSEPTEARLQRAWALHSSGQLAAAAAIYGDVLQREAANIDALYLLSSLLRQQGDAARALPLAEQAVRLQDSIPELHYNLALIRQMLGDDAGALAGHGRALQLNPQFAEAAAQLGQLHLRRGAPQQAADACRQALAANPRDVAASQNLGIACLSLGRYDEAEQAFRRVTELDPTLVEAWVNLGALMRGDGRTDEAIQALEQALRLDSGFPAALINIGIAYKDKNRYVEAESCLARALALCPDHAEARHNHALMLAMLADYRQVVAESDAALALKPDTPLIWEQRLYVHSYHPDLPAEAIYAEFKRWGDRQPPPFTDFGSHDRSPARRLRIGYVSPDFRRHTSRFFFFPLFANHNPREVELFAYSNVRQDDEFTARFKTLFAHWRDIRHLDAAAVADQVLSDGIDILIDCCNHMRDDRLDVFALKPAPIQATWLGAAWTTGLASVDYVLFDPFLAPEGTLARERILRLPHCFVAYQPPEGTPDPAPAPCLRRGHVSFGYSGRSERLNHRCLRAWGAILARIPDARLILDFGPFADPPTQDYFRRFLGELGVDTGRVVMRCSPDIFAGLADIDILLDCFPHSGGTMLFDALWMGVPVLSLASRPPVGRIGTSLLCNLGLPQWVARDEADYVAKACAFAADHQGLDRLRTGMRQRLAASPIMDGPGFARGVEAAYRTMFDDWRARAGDTAA